MSVILNMWGEDYAINFVKTEYSNNGNLAIQVMAHDEECDFWEPWCMATVNLNERLPENQAYLDTNNCSSEIIDWLYKNKYVKEIRVGFSGFCMYPLVEFSNAFMKQILV